MRSLVWLLLLATCTCGTPAYASLDSDPSYPHPKYEAIRNRLEAVKLPMLDSMKAVNDYANSKPYIADKQDSWQLPDSFLRNGGDCEDYALAKYAMGKEAHLFKNGYIILVLDVSRNMQAHALLVADDVVYDNQIEEPYPLDSKTMKRYQVVGKLRM